jgi:hypothetical protein
MNRGSTFLARASLLNTIDLRVLALALGTFTIGTDAFIIGGILPEIAQVRQHRQDRIGRFGILPVIRTRLAHRLGANPSRPKNPCSRSGSDRCLPRADSIDGNSEKGKRWVMRGSTSLRHIRSEVRQPECRSTPWLS